MGNINIYYMPLLSNATTNSAAVYAEQAVTKDCGGQSQPGHDGWPASIITEKKNGYIAAISFLF